MIEYYLHEKPILKNAPTYLPFYDEDFQYVMDNFDKLVIKDVAEAGGSGVVFGSSLSPEKREEFKETVRKERRRFIAQEVIDFLDIDIMDNNEIVPRKADLRAFVLSGKETKIWASGLTRFSRVPDLCPVKVHPTHGWPLVIRLPGNGMRSILPTTVGWMIIISVSPMDSMPMTVLSIKEYTEESPQKARMLR